MVLSRRALLGCLACVTLRLPRSDEPIAFAVNRERDTRCSFCGITGAEYPLVGRSGLWICWPCVDLFEIVLWEDGPGAIPGCSFCSRSGDRAALAGPYIAVCPECVHEGSRRLDPAFERRGDSPPRSRCYSAPCLT